MTATFISEHKRVMNKWAELHLTSLGFVHQLDIDNGNAV